MGKSDHVAVGNVVDFPAFISAMKNVVRPHQEERQGESYLMVGARLGVLFSIAGTDVACLTQPGKGKQLFDLVTAMSPAYDVALFGPEGEDIAERPDGRSDDDQD